MTHDELAATLQRIREGEKVELKAPLRAKLEADVEKYLSQGKQITRVPANARNLDPKLMNW